MLPHIIRFERLVNTHINSGWYCEKHLELPVLRKMTTQQRNKECATYISSCSMFASTATLQLTDAIFEVGVLTFK